jgi:hypothetical protein
MARGAGSCGRGRDRRRFAARVAARQQAGARGAARGRRGAGKQRRAGPTGSVDARRRSRARMIHAGRQGLCPVSRFGRGESSGEAAPRRRCRNTGDRSAARLGKRMARASGRIAAPRGGLHDAPGRARGSPERSASRFYCCHATQRPSDRKPQSADGWEAFAGGIWSARTCCARWKAPFAAGTPQ